MHLTRFEFNTARRGARSLLASPQKLHAAVQAAFPSTAHTTGEGRLLWRLDQRPHHVQLYLVSPDKPDLTHLVEEAGWPATHTWDTRDYTPLLTKLAAGQRWAFRLKANPVSSRRKNATATRSQRFGHVTADQQTHWLLTRSHANGFTIPAGHHGEPDLAVHGREVLRFHRNSATVTLATAIFEGILEINDAEVFRTSLINGIGPAKGYGCGLLTLAPARHG